MDFDMPNTKGMTQSQKLDVVFDVLGKIHECYHRSEEKADAREQIASQRRHETANAVMGISGAVGTLTSQVGELTKAQVQQSTTLTALATRLGIKSDPDGNVAEPEKVKPAVGAWSMKDMLMKGLPLVGGAFVVLAVIGPPFVNFLHECWERLVAYVYH